MSSSSSSTESPPAQTYPYHKSFECFRCKQQIRIKRRPDNSGWDRYNLDGQIHNCVSSLKKPTTTTATTAAATATVIPLQEKLESIESQLTKLTAMVEKALSGGGGNPAATTTLKNNKS